MPDAKQFFNSRWVNPPDCVTSVSSIDDRPAKLPAGFVASGLHAGIKPSGKHDIALLACTTDDCVSAARYTRSGAAAPSVLVSKDEANNAELRAVITTSGNANAGTGRSGFDDARAIQQAAADAVNQHDGGQRIDKTNVAVCATGVIGVPLPIEVIKQGVAQAGRQLKPEGCEDFRRGIETTDLFPKTATVKVKLSTGEVEIYAVCKGAGMIQPSFATMLCFVATDAKMSAETADLLFGVCIKRSFDRISVDGQLSTSDTAVLLASGASGVTVEAGSSDEQNFGLALDALLRQLALMIVRDGEGARRVGRVSVRCADGPACERIAREVANSPLVKTALYGGDPNWGRILQAVGSALPGPANNPVQIAIEGIEVCRDGQEVLTDVAVLAAKVSGPEVDYEIAIGPSEGAKNPNLNETEVFFSDLGHEYVTLNAEYTT